MSSVVRLAFLGIGFLLACGGRAATSGDGDGRSKGDGSGTTSGNGSSTGDGSPSASSTGDDEGPGNDCTTGDSQPPTAACSFACGAGECNAKSEYCETVEAGQSTPGGGTRTSSSSCKPLPAACANDRTCQCLQDQTNATACSDDGGQVKTTVAAL